MDKRGRDSTAPSREAEYFRTIEERFCALRGAAMLLAPRDWNLIAGWWQEKVPLSLVLESLEEVFVSRRRRGDAPERVNSLAYVRPEVLRRWSLHRQMMSSRRGEQEEVDRLRDQLRRHLGRLARGLSEASAALTRPDQENLARTVLAVAANLRRLRQEGGSKGWNPVHAEAALEKLDAEILRAAEAALEESQRQTLERKAEEILRPHRAGMKPEAFQESLAAVRGRLLRSEFGLPRLSLLGED
jgi:hypothetical protein